MPLPSPTKSEFSVELGCCLFCPWLKMDNVQVLVQSNNFMVCAYIQCGDVLMLTHIGDPRDYKYMRGKQKADMLFGIKFYNTFTQILPHFSPDEATNVLQHAGDWNWEHYTFE